MSKEIEKKTWPEYFELTRTGKKRYECRLADFDVEVGDILILKEWDPKTKKYTGRKLKKRILHKSHLDPNDTQWWPKEDIDKYGFHILSID
ncbi:DUF3850 domain-containing protein [Patescibacteria group bacterium]